ncbi:ROK family protein [Fundicoccus sp. Sow4_D5]|uniref:ROK family protein n=1 Tax=Fundicoccus sp. Sow4_D5 TaxID=3438782 RepID=UPI003F90D1B7
MLFGAIEAGGTKFVCAIGDQEFNVIEKISIPTTTPSETMRDVFTFFDRFGEELKSIGIGSFGPIDVDQQSKTYGYITNTPKLAWQYFDFVGSVKKRYNIPVAWTTDVNASALGEAQLGVGEGKKTVAYFTIGTGIGGGVIQDKLIIEGITHPEMGHLLVRRHSDDKYEGNCPFHKDCLEGMACGPAIEQRLGMKGQEVPADDPFWEIEAYYIAQMIYNVTINFAPSVIALGGGVMKKDGMLKKVRNTFSKLLNDYRPIPDIEEYIVLPKLNDNAAIIGCFSLAEELITK